MNESNTRDFDRFAVHYIQDLAAQRRITQTKMAELSGIKQYRISRAFDGGKPFSFEEMRALAGVFNMTLSRLAQDIEAAYIEKQDHE